MLVNVGTTPVGTTPTGVAAADVDGDGDLDLIVTAFGSADITVLLNDGSGVFTTVANSPFANGGQAFGVATADVDGNGTVDILATQHNGGNTRVHLGDGDGDFTAPGTAVAGTGTMLAIAVGDFNEDGDPDFVALDGGGNNLVHVQLGAAGATFTAAIGSAFATSAGPQGVAVGDLNGDGNLDFVLAASVNLDFFAGNGDGTFDPRATLASPAGGNMQGVALADLDGDGDLDAVVTQGPTDRVAVLLLDGTGGLDSTATYGVVNDPRGLVIEDVDFDGNLDLVVTNAGAGATAVSVLLGNGDGTFQAATSVTTGDQPREIAAGDFNGDGHIDFAVINQNDDNVALLVSTGFDIAADAPAGRAEGNSGTTSFTFTVTRFGSTSGAATVDWAVTGSGGSPANAGDFVGNVLPSGTVSFVGGEATKTITVNVAADMTGEASEGFTVTLSNPSAGFPIATATATAAIADDDTPAAPPPTAGGSGDDFAILNGQGTTYSAGDGNDRVFAMDGDDWVHGNAGNDYVNGGAGNDTAYGGKGDDEVLGEYGDDRLFGDAGNDKVNGGPGSDTAEGGEGDDQVRGGQGDDRVLGGAGNDFVSGDKGNDTLSGGSGADYFHIFAGAGADRATDFSQSQGDQVWVAAGSTWTVAQSGSDTVVTLSDGTTLTLAGVTASSLTDGWIFSA